MRQTGSVVGSARKAIEETWPQAYSDTILLSQPEKALAGKILQYLLRDMIAIYNRKSIWVLEEFEPPAAYEKYGALVTHGCISSYERAIQTFDLLGIVEDLGAYVFRVLIDTHGSAERLASRVDLTRRMLGELIEGLFRFDGQHGLEHISRTLESEFRDAGLLEGQGDDARWTDKMLPYLNLVGDYEYWDAPKFFDRVCS